MKSLDVFSAASGFPSVSSFHCKTTEMSHGHTQGFSKNATIIYLFSFNSSSHAAEEDLMMTQHPQMRAETCGDVCQTEWSSAAQHDIILPIMQSGP